jgi:hypothetical protein
MRRYAQSHVNEALAQVQSGGRIEPHSAIVLAGEVLALRDQAFVDRICPIHAIHMYVDAEGQMQCWHCGEGRLLKRLVLQLRGAVQTLLTAESDEECEQAIEQVRQLVGGIEDESPDTDD